MTASARTAEASPAHVGAADGAPYVGLLIDLAERLRAAGAAVSIGEVIDGARALGHVDLLDRGLVRTALRACLVKRSEDVAVFDAAFEAAFALRAGERAALSTGDAPPSTWRPSADSAAPRGGGPASASTDLLEALLDALRTGDAGALAALAAIAVGVHGGLDDRIGTERYHAYRVLRALDLSTLLQAAMRAARDELGPHPDPLALRLRREELGAAVEELRRAIAAEIRKRLAAAGPAEPPPPPVGLHDVELLHASRQQLAELRRAVRPLARKLASRVSQRRRIRHRGRLDARRTVRRSLSYGGVPLDVALRTRRTSKPDLVLLCDVSGSVAEFAHFTLSLVHAMHDEFARLRTFVFVDGVAEVTDMIERSEHALDPFHLLATPGVVDGDGHSDYGRVFERFGQHHLATTIGPSTTVIVTGDARSNGRDLGLDAFRGVCARARRVYWLNPEPLDEWNTEDSVIERYAGLCTGVFEVRTLRQLEDAVVAIV